MNQINELSASFVDDYIKCNDSSLKYLTVEKYLQRLTEVDVKCPDFGQGER